MDNGGVREVKARLNIVDVVRDYLPMKQSGNTYWGKCPFHNEKTPSFSVSTDRQTFHCFGCGKGGDVFTFIMEIENIGFRDALETLALRAGVSLKQGENHYVRSRKEQTDILEMALGFFCDNILNSSSSMVLNYLEQRKITPAMCRDFELGWAPASWDELARLFKTKDINEIIQLESGLISRGEHGVYDRFRGRVMFPIRDDRCKLVGFGGRLIGNEGAKYLNSPESDQFNKRRLLYLLGRAKKDIREKKRLILVEGYIDAIRAHIMGFKETVASLGTALTQEQGALIKRFSDLSYICYDADSAGQEAALRGMYVLQRCGIEVRVITLPEERDPDEILLVEGEKFFDDLIRKALPLPRYHALVRRSSLNDPSTRRRAQEDLLSGLASLPPLDVAPHLAAISQVFGVLPHELQREIIAYRDTVKDSHRTGLDEADHIEPEKLGKNDIDDLECALCSRLWCETEFCTTLEPERVVPLFTDDISRSIALALLSGEKPEDIQERWRQLGDVESIQRIARGNALIARDGLETATLEGLLELMEWRRLKTLYEGLRKRILAGTADENDLRQYQVYARQLKSRGG